MSYVALYREWRPQKFSDIVGQEHISRTLQNAIRSDRIAHAYLFCGPRGTGKTTTAKVLAKALNCLNGPADEPCNECENCKRVTEGTSMDVMEIDAASNRGIDEIRDLREKVKFAPTEGKYRIYIIDEVHMLTTEAFNALLKTLEEPPAHVIFVLATTEPHKIPLTILSRCQRFDFRRISVNNIAGRLRSVAEDLGIETENEVFSLIAKTAEGGMRDALSVLDQCISFGGKKVSLEDVEAVLGAANKEFLFQMADCLKNGDTTAGLKLIDELVRQGKDIRQFAKDLTEHFRNLLLIEVCGDIDELVPVSGETQQRMREQASGLGRRKAICLIEMLTAAEREMKWASQPRLTMELSVIRSGEAGLSGDYAALEERIDRLEKMMVSGHAAATAQASAVFPAKKAGPKPAKSPGPVPAGGAREQDEAQASGAAQSVDTDTVMKLWGDILERIKKVRMSARAFLIESEPVRVENGNLVLSFPPGYSFHKEKVEQPENRKAIEQVIKEVTGAALNLKCKFADEISEAAPSGPVAGQGQLVEEAIRLFGGDVIEIKD